MNEQIRPQAPHRIIYEYGDVPGQHLRLWANGPEDRDLDIFKVLPGPVYSLVDPLEI